MKRTHALLISLVLAVCVIAGSFAALGNQRLAQRSAPHISSSQFLQQTGALDRAEARLRAELRRRPPAIPAVPAAAPAAAAAPPPTIVYHRPPPIVHVVHHAGGHELEHDSSGDGGGSDD